MVAATAEALMKKYAISAAQMVRRFFGCGFAGLRMGFPIRWRKSSLKLHMRDYITERGRASRCDGAKRGGHSNLDGVAWICTHIAPRRLRRRALGGGGREEII